MKPPLLILLACTAACAAAGLRGVDPALLQRYVASADGQWACLDGLRTIPFSRVNDDYCDCFDGSDEPGTPACPNSHFYCRNLGHEPLRLNASMVDDGVCDCCDGSDEPAGACPNRCKELGAEALKSLVAEVAAAEAGVRAKQKYIEEAAGLKKGWQQRLDKLEAEVAAQQAVVDAAQGKRDELQQKEHKLQDQKREAEEAERKRQQAQQVEQAAQQPAAQQAGQQESGAAEAGGAQEAEAAPAEGQGGGAAPVAAGEGAAAGAAAAEGAGAPGEGESAEEIARRVAAQWIPGAKREEGEAQPSSGGGGEGAAASGAGAEEEEEQPLGEDDGELGPAEEEGEEDQVSEDAGYDPAQDLAAGEEDLYPAGAEEEEEGEGEGEGDEQPSPYDESPAAAASAQEPAQPAKPAQPPAAQAPAARAPTPQIVVRLAEWASAAKAWLTAHLPEAVSRHAAQGFDWLLAHTPPHVLDWGRKLAAKLPFELPGTAEPRPTSAVDAELDAVRRELTQARAAATREERKLRDLKDEQKGLQDNLGREYGPEGEFTKMVGKCFEAKVDKYTYEVCPFKKAAQKEGHSSTNLGSWGGFGEGHASMKFTGGAHCWQGPARSIEVSLHCGPAEELTHVEEPSRCEYHAQLATPAACSAEALQALKERLAAKQALLDASPAGHDEL